MISTIICMRKLSLLEQEILSTKDKNSKNHHVYIHAEVVHTYSSMPCKGILLYQLYIIEALIGGGWELMKKRSYI